MDVKRERPIWWSVGVIWSSFENNMVGTLKARVAMTSKPAEVTAPSRENVCIGWRNPPTKNALPCTSRRFDNIDPSRDVCTRVRKKLPSLICPACRKSFAFIRATTLINVSTELPKVAFSTPIKEIWFKCVSRQTEIFLRKSASSNSVRSWMCFENWPPKVSFVWNASCSVRYPKRSASGAIASIAKTNVGPSPQWLASATKANGAQMKNKMLIFEPSKNGFRPTGPCPQHRPMQESRRVQQPPDRTDILAS